MSALCIDRAPGSFIKWYCPRRLGGWQRRHARRRATRCAVQCVNGSRRSLTDVSVIPLAIWSNYGCIYENSHGYQRRALHLQYPQHFASQCSVRRSHTPPTRAGSIREACRVYDVSFGRRWRTQDRISPQFLLRASSFAALLIPPFVLRLSQISACRSLTYLVTRVYICCRFDGSVWIRIVVKQCHLTHTSCLVALVLPTTMCPPPLNEDITAQIASYLDSPDAHRLALTSRVFYTPATQHALKDVTIRSFTAAMQFFDYMLHDMSDRLPCLRCLRILCPMESDARFATPAGHSKGNYKAAASLLADLLEAAPGLRVLALHSAPVWMANERRISSAITSMRHLQELEFTDIGRCVVDTLFRLRSTPHKLTLADARQNRYPYALRNVSAQSALGRQGTYRAWLQYGKLAFQSVRELTVDALYDLPPASHLARLFPNVREVNFGDNAAELPWVGRKCSNSSYASRRVVAWPSLECVRGTGCGLKSWWNAHPVHCLELLSPIKCAGPTTYNGAWGRVSADDESEDVLMAMHNLQPVALLATFSAEMGVGYLRSLFAASQRVRYVALEVWEVYRYETWLMDLSKWWVSFMTECFLYSVQSVHPRNRPHSARHCFYTRVSLPSQCAVQWQENRTLAMPQVGMTTRLALRFTLRKLWRACDRSYLGGPPQSLVSGTSSLTFVRHLRACTTIARI